MTALRLRRGIVVGPSSRGLIRFPPVSREARWVWVAVALFIAMSVWWLISDTRVPDWDTGAHEYAVYLFRTQLSQGHLANWFTGYYTYAPLTYLVGAVASLIAGFHPMVLVLSSNVVFVPLLAFGCFGTARIAYGPRAGVLAAVVALGSPMFISMMHEYELETGEAAMVAVSVWAILASRRFERVGIAALAGVLSGLALMTKQTAPIFLAGLVLLALIRGGWRNWRGLIAAGVAVAVVAGPWYIYHWTELHGTLTTFTSSPSGNTSGGYSLLQQPPRLSIRNFGWYGWDLINEQVLTPFTVLFVIGVVLAVVRVVRRGVTAASVEPELLGGLIVSYLGMTYVTFKDPRYTLPMLVYVAVFATGWIANLTLPRLRRWLSAGVVALAAVYFVGLSAGIGSAVRIPLPGKQENMLYQWQLTMYETDGWVRGEPQHDANVPALMDGLRRAGIRAVALSVGPNPIDFNSWGLMTLAEAHGLLIAPAAIPADQQADLILGPPGSAGPPPCQRLSDGSGIYVVREPAPGFDPGTLRNPSNPRQRYTFLCPGRPPLSAT